MNQYDMKLWVRIIIAALFPLFGLLQISLVVENLIIFASFTLIGIFVFYVFTYDFVILDSELQESTRLRFNKVRRISFDNIISIDATKKIGLVFFYLRLNPKVVKHSFFEGIDEIWEVPPYIIRVCL